MKLSSQGRVATKLSVECEGCESCCNCSAVKPLCPRGALHDYISCSKFVVRYEFCEYFFNFNFYSYYSLNVSCLQNVIPAFLTDLHNYSFLSDLHNYSLFIILHVVFVSDLFWPWCLIRDVIIHKLIIKNKTYDAR